MASEKKTQKTKLHNIKNPIDLKKRQKKTYPGTKIKGGEENERQLFLDFLIGNAEKGTYDKGYMGMGEKKKKIHLFRMRTL